MCSFESLQVVSFLLELHIRDSWIGYLAGAVHSPQKETVQENLPRLMAVSKVGFIENFQAVRDCLLFAKPLGVRTLQTSL